MEVVEGENILFPAVKKEVGIQKLVLNFLIPVVEVLPEDEKVSLENQKVEGLKVFLVLKIEKANTPVFNSLEIKAVSKALNFEKALGHCKDLKIKV